MVVEQGPRPVMRVAMSSTRSSPGNERLGVAGLEGPGEKPVAMPSTGSPPDSDCMEVDGLVEVEVEQASRPVMPAALSTTRSSPGRERLGVAGLEGRGETPREALGTRRPGEEAREGSGGEQGGGGATGEGRKVERI